MNRKSLLGLILFAVFVTVILFFSADYLTGQNNRDTGRNQSYTKDNASDQSIARADASEITSDDTEASAGTGTGGNTPVNENNNTTETIPDEPWLTANPSDTGLTAAGNPVEQPTSTPADNPVEQPTSTPADNPVEQSASTPADNPVEQSASTPANNSAQSFATPVPEVSQAAGAEQVINTFTVPELITDSSKVDYEEYIPEMVTDSELETALDITNPDISVTAEAAILFDADTGKVLFYKNPVQAMFPASTAKLLTSLVALERCSIDEQVTLGDEITMIASDSTTANLKEGEVLTVRNLLEGMLLPSGNDAAYAVAAYVGRKSLGNPDASGREAVAEFVRLMNMKAASLGVKNSCFKTPDGYDAVGQYTTAYDMGVIGVAASKNSVITDISQKSRSRNIFVSGEDITWDNTNKLVTKYSGQYYSHAIGLKTGTSTMAGKCIVAAAKENGKEVVCVIMDSSSEGRWEDAIALLKYGLK